MRAGFSIGKIQDFKADLEAIDQKNIDYFLFEREEKNAGERDKLENHCRFEMQGDKPVLVFTWVLLCLCRSGNNALSSLSTISRMVVLRAEFGVSKLFRHFDLKRHTFIGTIRNCRTAAILTLLISIQKNQ
ncbi:MAG: hypothetical protein ACRYGB_04420 [Janthinobacterium lividum]